MRVVIVLPNKTLLDDKCIKITAPGVGGSFQILPRHIDVVWNLEDGILEIAVTENRSRIFAIENGILVKEGSCVYITCFNAIEGKSLEELYKAMETYFYNIDEQEKKSREILTKLELDMFRKFVEFGGKR